MVRITSFLMYAMSVPFLTPRGVEPKFFTVPAMEDGEPGVVELEELDAITIERLRWHYDWRPTDVKNKGKPREQLAANEVANIGLLKIEIFKDQQPAAARKPEIKKGAPKRPTLEEVAAKEGATAAT